MKLIDKDALVAEIESSIRSLEKCLRGEFPMAASVFLTEQCKGRLDAYKNVLSLINALEVKEVDLEKELIEWHKEHFKKDGTFIGRSGFYLKNSSQVDIAKQFFELGLKIQKGE